MQKQASSGDPAVQLAVADFTIRRLRCVNRTLRSAALGLGALCVILLGVVAWN